MEPPTLGADPLPLLERLLAEQDLTPFYVYKEDVRTLELVLAHAWLTEAGAVGRSAVQESLRTAVLPAPRTAERPAMRTRSMR